MKFAKLVFWCAGLGGVLGLTPLYFILHFIDLRIPPPVSQPVFYFGFLGVVLVWHCAFCLIGTDPVRFRPMMVPGIFEKFVFVATVLILYIQRRVSSHLLWVAGIDLLLGFLFVASFFKTPRGEFGATTLAS